MRQGTATAHVHLQVCRRAAGAHASAPPLWSQRLRRFSPGAAGLAAACTAGGRPFAGGGGSTAGASPDALVGRASNSRSSASRACIGYINSRLSL